jgi:hypothetical protein
MDEIDDSPSKRSQYTNQQSLCTIITFAMCVHSAMVLYVVSRPTVLQYKVMETLSSQCKCCPGANTRTPAGMRLSNFVSFLLQAEDD